MIEIDGTGNGMRGTGAMEMPNGSGGISVIDPYEGLGNRMALDPEPASTPTP